MIPTLIRLHAHHTHHKAPAMPKFFQEGLTLDHVRSFSTSMTYPMEANFILSIVPSSGTSHFII